MKFVTPTLRLLWLAISGFVLSLRANWGIAIFALGISIALWATVVNEQNPPQTGAFNNLVKVQPVSVPPGLDVLREIEPVVVRITAPLDVWQQISVNSFKATVDVTGLGPGEHDAPVRVESLDGRVRVNDVFPGKVKVELDASQSVTLPVKVMLQQMPPFGYRASEPKATVGQAVVTGPAQLISSVESVIANVDLSTTRTDFHQTVRLVARTGRGYDVSGVSVEPAQVQVDVPIEREVNFQSMAVVAEVKGSPQTGFWLSRAVVRPSAVTIVGPRDVLQPLSFIKTVPVDLTGLSASVVRQVQVDLPIGVNVIGPKTVDVELTVSPVRGSVVVRVPPRFDGLAAGRQLANDALSLEVTVTGEGLALAEITPERVLATIDLRNLGPGTHRLEPRIAVPTGLQVQSVNPATLSVTLR